MFAHLLLKDSNLCIEDDHTPSKDGQQNPTFGIIKDKPINNFFIRKIKHLKLETIFENNGLKILRKEQKSAVICPASINC